MTAVVDSEISGVAVTPPGLEMYEKPLVLRLITPVSPGRVELLFYWIMRGEEELHLCLPQISCVFD